MAVSATSNVPTGQRGQQVTTGYDAFNDVEIEDFINLMVAELQNQDPLNPMDNAQILQQMSQIREIAASDALTDTLESVFLGQNVSTASGMIGDWIMKVSDEGAVEAVGQVDRVRIEDGVPTLSIDGRPLVMKGSPDLEVLTPEFGQEVADALEMLHHTIRGKSVKTHQSDSHEVTGRVTQVLCKDGKLQFHIETDAGNEYAINSDDVLEDLTAQADTTQTDTTETDTGQADQTDEETDEQTTDLADERAKADSMTWRDGDRTAI